MKRALWRVNSVLYEHGSSSGPSNFSAMLMEVVSACSPTARACRRFSGVADTSKLRFFLELRTFALELHTQCRASSSS
jgi:hypothetical protein